MILGVASGQTVRQTYILATHPSSELASFCPDENNDTRCLTLEQLIVNATSVLYFTDDSEIIFQSGLHVISGLRSNNLTVYGETGSMVVRGETDNVTIHCQQRFNFLFKESGNINMSNITFNNCTGYNQSTYTVVYYKQIGNLTLDRIQIINKDGAGIAVYMMGDSFNPFRFPVQTNLTNSKISTGSIGVYVGYYYLFYGLGGEVYIDNTSFSGSCLEFKGKYFNPARLHYDILLKNVTIEKSACLTVLALRGSNVKIVLEEVRMADNRSPYLIHANESRIHMLGGNTLESNSGVAYLTKSTLLFSQARVNFTKNVVLTSHGVPLFAKDSQVVFESSCITFENNKGMQCGGITALRTQLIFSENSTVNFIHNSGEKGGAISLGERSVIRFMLSNQTIVNFERNEARRGGAIFVEDSGYIDTFNHKLIASVFKQTEHNGEYSQNVELKFSQNIAQIGGDNIYGGWIDWSVGEDGNITYNSNLSNIFKSDINGVASDPVRVCLCTNGYINCSISEHRMKIFGHAFNLSLVAVGQRLAPVIEFVEAKLEDNPGNTNNGRMIKEDHKVQIVQKSCTVLRYIILFPNHEETVSITPLRKEFSPNFDQSLLRQFPTYNTLFKQLSVNLKIRSCPLGFTLHTTDRTCVCLSSLTTLGLRCDLNEYKVVRGKRQWVGVADHHTKAGDSIIAHQHCPYDYCRIEKESLSIRLEDQDEQCAFNRTGTLCGSCKDNLDLSRVLGTSRCKSCSNRMLFVLAPTFLLSGLFLIIFLMLLNLTVSVGTINGLTFYANVVRAQHATFFTANTSNSFLSWFIAWLNLDQGLESCLYDGLDDYIITWLQFLFPLYIWLIAAALIVSSHYSTRISKLTGKNAVPVLATLFLISYTKVLRFAIDAISFTTITYPDGYKKTVWLVDGNVEFFRGKHIPLLIVTVLFLLLTLPYTFILLTIQLIYKISHYRVMCWVQRLKPLIDAYTGPYRPPHRYWTGLLLVARIILLVTFSVNRENNLSTNLIATITVSFLLIGWISSVGSVYESPLNNFLETVFLANVGITSTAVLFNLSNKIESPVAIYISTSLTFAIFVLIVLYHTQRQLLLTRVGSRLKIRFLTALSAREGYEEQIDEDVERRNKGRSFARRRSQVTSTIMQSFEKVYKVYHPDELKESLLTD